MNRANGFIALYRKMLDWEWHSNPNTLSTFIHILLGANHEDGMVKGVLVKRGQLLTSLPSLAEETGQTIRQVRVSLDHLKMTGEVTDKSTNKYRVITVVKYDDYQDNGRQNGRQMTDNAADKRQAKRQQYNNINNMNNKEIHSPSENGIKKFTPPTTDDVDAYCDEKGIFGFDSQKFVDYYTSNGWMVGRNKMKDWQATIRTWIKNDKTRQKKTDLDLPY